MTISKELLSGSTNGRPIDITGTASGSADTLHTTGATAKDEIWLWAVNQDASDHKLTIEFGAATPPIEVTIPAEDGLYLVVPGLLLSGSDVVKAFADAASKIAIAGYVNRHS